jgi:hypothetical protein
MFPVTYIITGAIFFVKYHQHTSMLCTLVTVTFRMSKIMSHLIKDIKYYNECMEVCYVEDIE